MFLLKENLQTMQFYLNATIDFWNEVLKDLDYDDKYEQPINKLLDSLNLFYLHGYEAGYEAGFRYVACHKALSEKELDEIEIKQFKRGLLEALTDTVDSLSPYLKEL